MGEQSFIKIVRNSMLRTPLASPTFLRTSIKTKSSKEDIERIEKRIDAVRSHCIRAEGRKKRPTIKFYRNFIKSIRMPFQRLKKRWVNSII